MIDRYSIVENNAMDLGLIAKNQGYIFPDNKSDTIEAIEPNKDYLPKEEYDKMIHSIKKIIEKKLKND